MDENQQKYGNMYADKHGERSVISKDTLTDPLYNNERTRYNFAAELTYGSVLDIGCSSGFGSQFLKFDSYLGIDYDEPVIKFAAEQFGTEKIQFKCISIDDLLKTEFFFDTIVCFEVLEHITNGKEVAQELKKHCNILIISTPYKEPYGFWGKYHVMHQLTEADFPEFNYKFLDAFGEITDIPTEEPSNVMLGVWKSNEVYNTKEKILCSIPTKNRYDYLFHCLQSVAMQTLRPDKVVIYDDTPEEKRIDIREHPIGSHLLKLLKSKGIAWEVVFGSRFGQHVSHEQANNSGFGYVWRIDDDCIAEPNVLEQLFSYITRPKIGASAGAVFNIKTPDSGGSNKIEDFFDRANIQWGPDQGIHSHQDVDFLYSSFLYKTGIEHYKQVMSPAAFHEETIFTHRMKRNGWNLIADTNIKTYHLQAPSGGTRETSPWAYAWDRKEFVDILENEWNIKLIYLGVGLGDNYAFKNIIPELKKKYKVVIIGTIYPEVFADTGIKTVPHEQIIAYTNENVYDWMAHRHWSGSIVDAYRGMYL